MRKILICAALLGMSACNHHEARIRSANEALARTEGAKAAELAIKARPGMERERAVLSIRAKAQQISAAGDTLAAAAYLSAAKARLDSAGILK